MSHNNLVAYATVFPLVYITNELYSDWERHLKTLETKFNTKIEFDFIKQCFNIQGRSQNNCENAARLIINKLLPVLNNGMDENRFHGTYPDIELDIPELTPIPNISPSIVTSPTLTNLSLDDNSHSPLPEIPRTESQTTVQDYHDDKIQSSSPMEQHSSYYTGDTESDGESEEEIKEFSTQFVIARNIIRPNEVFTGPAMGVKQHTNYIRLIEEETGTECALLPNGRTINITGSSQESVDDAASRFLVLQTAYKRSSRRPIVVPCIHPNAEDPRPFRLFFADKERYRHKDSLFVPPDFKRPLYVLLPVYNDPRTGEPAKPTDLIDISAQTRQQSMQQTQPEFPALPKKNRSPPGFPSSINTINTVPQRYTRSPSTSSTPSSPLPSPSPRETTMTSTWGSNTVSQTHTTVLTPEAEQWRNRPITPNQPLSGNSNDDFPSLPTTPARKPSVQSPGKGIQRRVIRISNQKAAKVNNNSNNQVSTSIFDQCREYNFHNARFALTEGLQHVRSLRGEIRIGAKLGKVLWNNMTPTVSSQLWEFQDIKDVVMNEMKVRSIFNNVTTKSEQVMDAIAQQIPEHFARTACFEIHAQARNQPTLPYQPIIMILNPGAVGLKKVVLKKERISEVNWVSLDRKFDFQIYMDAEQCGRTDVKPYSTFLKKLMINTSTLQMTYEDIPDFLHVTHIYYKQTTKFYLHFPFIAHITMVERLDLQPVAYASNGKKMSADTGKGEVWFDCEVICGNHEGLFNQNLDLPIGKEASWTVKDIWGENEQLLFDFIKCLIILTEKCQKAVK